MIVVDINEYEFCKLMDGRFSGRASVALYKWLEEIAHCSPNEHYVVDPIELSGQWSEYDSIEEAMEACYCDSVDDLKNTYIVIEFDDGVLVSE